MKTNRVITLAAFCVLCLCSRGFAKLPAWSGRVVKPDPAAVTAASAFLANVDSNAYSSAYAQLAARCRRGGAGGEQQILAYFRARREPLGKVRSRSLSRARSSNTISGGPDGSYEFLDYETAFVRKAHGIEIVTLTKESGHWEVSGYHVY
jgi:ABC-type Fe3+ transport system substrate-binding protein